MFRQPSDRPTPACNDNGSFFRRRWQQAAFPSTILHAARDTVGAICLSYVAHGVFIISRQEPTAGRIDRRGARAA